MDYYPTDLANRIIGVAWPGTRDDVDELWFDHELGITESFGMLDVMMDGT